MPQEAEEGEEQVGGEGQGRRNGGGRRKEGGKREEATPQSQMFYTLRFYKETFSQIFTCLIIINNQNP